MTNSSIFELFPEVNTFTENVTINISPFDEDDLSNNKGETFYSNGGGNCSGLYCHLIES